MQWRLHLRNGPSHAARIREHNNTSNSHKEDKSNYKQIGMRRMKKTSLLQPSYLFQHHHALHLNGAFHHSLMVVKRWNKCLKLEPCPSALTKFGESQAWKLCWLHDATITRNCNLEIGTQGNCRQGKLQTGGT
jgi:hypothetical protein